MKISVIIVTHNRPELMRKALLSAYKEQDLSPFEVILVDNGSSYDVREVLREEIFRYTSLKIISLPKNNPCIGNLYNKALGIIRGDSVIFLSDDCELVPGSLKILADRLGKSKIVTGRVHTLDYRRKATLPNVFNSRKWIYGKKEKINLTHLSSSLISRDYFEKRGGFDPLLKRDYSIDFFNRMFSNKDSFPYLIVPAMISKVLVGTPDNLVSTYKRETPIKRDSYPMKGYWSERKSFATVSDDQDFINLFNSRDNALNQPWVGTTKRQDASVVLSWAYTSELSGNEGSQKLYYLDYHGLEESQMADICDGYVSQFPLSKDKPSYILRPTIPLNTLRRIDRHYANKPSEKGLRILCLDINENNLDFLYVLLDHVCQKFKKVTLIHREDKEVTYLLRELPHLRRELIKYVDYSSLKDTRPTVILGLSPDENDYVQSHKDFMLSGVLRVPLVSTPNKGFDNLLRDSIDYYEAVGVNDFIRCFQQAVISDKVGQEARVTLNTHYREDTVYNSFIYYLNEIMENRKLIPAMTPSLTEIKVSQKKRDCSAPIGVTPLVQNISHGIDYANTLEVDIYLKVSANVETQLVVAIFNSEGKHLEECAIPSYKIKNGVNTFSFIESSQGELLSYFSISSPVPFCEVSVSNCVRAEGYLEINGKPTRSCLEFTVRDSVY